MLDSVVIGSVAEANSCTQSFLDHERLMSLAKAIVDASNGLLEIAHNEANDSNDEDLEAEYFLKLRGQRLGRDIGVYFIMSEVMGWEQMLPFILEEVLFALNVVPLLASYQAGAERIREIGKQVYTDEQFAMFDTLF